MMVCKKNNEHHQEFNSFFFQYLGLGGDGDEGYKGKFFLRCFGLDVHSKSYKEIMISCTRNNEHYQEIDSDHREHTILSMLQIWKTSILNPRNREQ